MATLAPITIPTELIRNIPRPTDLIERVAKAVSEDPNLAPLYENTIRDTMERFEATGSVDPILKPGRSARPLFELARIGAGARERVSFFK
jgi:hypothetical protein